MSSARIEELRKKFDENPRRYFAPLANEYRKAGDFDQAIFICQEYLPQQPGHMSGHIVFGQALFEAKRLPEAKTVFETALSLDPENLIALRHLADISRDLGDAANARIWYERVLQADPRNEEIAAIMEKLGSAAAAQPTPAAVAAAVAPTAETPAKPAPSTANQARPATPSSSAPTVELSAAQVQEMLKARTAAKPPVPPPPPPEPTPSPEPVTLDATPTIELNMAEAAAPQMEGLEPTSFGTMDLPTIEPLGLEPTSLGGQTEAPAADPAPLDGLDTISLEISVPGAAPVAPTVEIPAINPPTPEGTDDGLLDLGSLELGAPAQPVSAQSATETPIDGGHDSSDLLDLDFPSTPEPEPPPAPAQPAEPATLIMEAVKSVIPAVKDAVESAVPVVLDAVESAAPAVMDFVEAAVESPTVIMEAIKRPSKEAAEPPVATTAPEPTAEPRPSQSVPFVTETMAQLYLSQGHRAEAIDIYRKLIEARPGDTELRGRLAAIESEERSATTPPPRTTPSAPAARRFAGSGPSVRTVLRELFGLDGSTTLGSAPVASVPAEVGSIDMLFAADSVAGALSPLAVAFDGGYVAGQGTIDELFAGGR